MCPVTESRVPVYVASVIPGEVGIQWKVGNGDSQLAPLEVISSLVTRLLRAAQEGRLADVKAPLEEALGLSSAVPTVGGAERGQSVRERVRVCFSCRCPRHGVNRCSQVDTSFPFLSQGWSVDSGMANIERYRPAELECGLLRETRDGPGGRVSLPDHRREASRHGSCRWAWAWTQLGFEHTCFSATGEPSHGSSWAG